MSLSNLGSFLSALGRREDALEAANEAVRLYRDLATARPDAFSPDLAISLAVRANCLEALDRAEEAQESNREAIAELCPVFLRTPQAVIHSMLPMCSQYLERCGALGMEPDTELLGPIVEALQTMQPPREPKGAEWTWRSRGLGLPAGAARTLLDELRQERP